MRNSSLPRIQGQAYAKLPEMLPALLPRLADRGHRHHVSLVLLGAALGVLVLVAVTASAQPFLPDSLGPGQDARAYWAASSTVPYAPGSVGQESAYLYSPAFLQILEPLRELRWTAFLAVWTIVLLGALMALSGPVLFIPLLAFALFELWGGNIHLLLALAIVLGFRWPAAWAFVLLTKVTPGVGLVWFVVRREWRSLAIAGGATALVAGASFYLAPALWLDWLDLLATSTGSSTVAGSVPIPLLWRLPVAVVLIAWAARTDRPWLLPVGALLALPVIWWGGLTLLVACVALRRAAIEEWLVARSRSASVRAGPGASPAEA